MAGSKPNLTNPNHTFDDTKFYKRVVFQQGKPILDVDLNDISEAVETQTTALLAEKMGYGPPQLDYREWAMTAVNGGTVNHPQNSTNFAVTLGRLDTLKGVIDTTKLGTSGTASHFVFDSHLLSSQSQPDPRAYTNYVLKGKVTEATSDTAFQDSNKDFDNTLGGHRLSIYDENVEITGNSGVLRTSALSTSFTSLDFVLNLSESACRVVFTTGALSGSRFTIVNASGTQIEVIGGISNAAVGDEYVILPPNTLGEYKVLYDAASTFDQSKSEGLTGLPKLVTYVQVFEEDVSTEEDPAIQSSVYGAETTHRTQLRWCVRVAKLKMSVAGDTYQNNAVGALTTYHISKYLSDASYDVFRLLTDGDTFTDLIAESRNHPSFWKELDAPSDLSISKQSSPFSDSLGVSPAHFYTAIESSIDRIFWSFLKAVFLQTSGTTFNDFVVLSVFNSETKSSTGIDQSQQTLSPYFYPNNRTNTSVTPLVHAFLSTGASHTALAGDTAALPGEFKSPPRVFTTHADLSTDNMKSRTLHGVRGGLIYGTATPLVFDSVANHFSFIDQALLGLSGIGSAQGANSFGERVPDATDFLLPDTTTKLAQSGYGVGAVSPINPLSSATQMTGFLTGTSSYELREKGGRTSHTVNWDDEDLGWSVYRHEDNINADGESDFSIRGWEEGIAQSVAFLRGLNFRKLAIKTTAHKSQDLFTISESPVRLNNEVGEIIGQASSSIAFQIPFNQSEDNNGNLFLDSYSGCVNDAALGGEYVNFSATNFIPANVTRFDPKPLLEQYQATGGIKDFNNSPQGTANSHRDLVHTYGPWNRFDTAGVSSSGNFTSDTNSPTYVGDLWSNRCTAMRLRYHVGDFYPGAADDRSIPANSLIDSMTLHMKVEPLSLAHWMTMPKHQHSILESSISFAEGIEALLKIANGLGDTQKLVNASGQPLIQSNSPALLEGSGDYQSRAVGEVDPLNLPFEHHRHPFVHWYHPAMHKVQAPHPDGTNDTYTNSANQSFKITPYPKWGRRSMIVPALVPSTFGATTLLDHTGSNEIYTVPYIVNEATGERAFPDGVSTDHDVSDNIGINLEDVTGSTGFATAGEASLPYPYHASASTNTGTTNIVADDNTTITFRNNQITFPAVGGHGAELRPGPVFLPASRIYAEQNGNNTKVKLGFNTMLSPVASTRWNDINATEDYFPYDERDTLNTYEAGGQQSDLPLDFQQVFTAWSVPVMRAAINTHTVAGVVALVRTSFETGLNSVTLSTDYEFTMPTNVFNNYSGGDYTYRNNSVPAIGPDNPVDTLFVGDLGTALGGFTDRSGFMSPLNLGVPMRYAIGLMPNDMVDITTDVRDSFERTKHQFTLGGGHLLLDSFAAINNMGLQQKLMWNCSFRVLHTRPSGMDGTASTAPKSLTEVFLAHDRTSNMATKTLPAPSGAFKKPFIHLMSTHPATNNSFPNKAEMAHLYPLVSDSTGGTHDTAAYSLDANGLVTYDYTTSQVKTSSMGDTYAADPFDYTINNALLQSDNPLRGYEKTKNSGIEIDLLHELNLMHNTPTDYGIDTTASVNGTDITLQEMIPTANELTLPGDHELVFVLYTGHYGAKLYDTDDDVDISYIPSVAGCHLSATLEINRPSDRVKSTASDEHHYGVTVDGNPINTHSIPSTK